MVRDLFQVQKEYIDHFFDNIDLEATERIVQKILTCRGNIILTGVGKSGIIANKLAMTMLSTGTKAIFLSPTDALHGDLGIVSKDDMFITLSKSGETREIIDLIPYVRKKQASFISIVSKKSSTLAKLADLSIYLPVKKELCPFNLAPTTSTEIQLIFGDVLAVELMRRKNFSITEFAINHPSGHIGKKITLKVKDLMLKDEEIPLCGPKDRLVDLISLLSEKKCGALIIVDSTNSLLGVFTDGDLRRSIERDKDRFLYKNIEDLMTRSPQWVSADILAYEAMKEMEKDGKKLITILPVLDEAAKVIGVIRMHDILQAGLKD